MQAFIDDKSPHITYICTSIFCASFHPLLFEHNITSRMIGIYVIVWLGPCVGMSYELNLIYKIMDTPDLNVFETILLQDGDI